MGDEEPAAGGPVEEDEADVTGDERSRREAEGPDELEIGGRAVEPGERVRMELPAARLPTGNLLGLPVEVIRGRRPGPRIWLSGALHGDEVGGVEIVRRVVERLDPGSLSGAVIAIPIVNVFGFVFESRYLPDRRDLNRSFPGSSQGSLAAQLAHLLMEEVVANCGYGIDFHSGSDDRANLPQIRAVLDGDDEVLRCARAFGAPLTLDGSPPAGSLREAAMERGVKVLSFEGGEVRRFDDEAVAVGTAGTLRVLACLGMREGEVEPATETRIARSSRWIRAPRSGLFHRDAELGEVVADGARLGRVMDAFGDEQADVRCRAGGMVIGVARAPLVNRGDALVHLATLEEGDREEQADGGGEAGS